MAPGPALEWLVSGSCPDRESFLHRRNGMDTVGDLSGKRHRGTLWRVHSCQNLMNCTLKICILFYISYTSEKRTKVLGGCQGWRNSSERHYLLHYLMVVINLCQRPGDRRRGWLAGAPSAQWSERWLGRHGKRSLKTARRSGWKDPGERGKPREEVETDAPTGGMQEGQHCRMDRRVGLKNAVLYSAP